jgi:Mrp family chromosome partitioning ATPase
MEGEIVELNRKKELEETNYRKYAASLEQGRLDEAMSSGHVSNISEIQSPSLPLKAKSKRLQIVLGLAVGGLAIGLGLAFAIELFFDKTIKRPKEIEQRLNLPLFLSIPVVDKAFTRRLQQNQGPGGKTDGNQQLAVKDSAASERLSHALQQYHATLRDRLLQFFDNQNLTHKPKMVAVTGLSNHAGVTTTAAGLAQSLSETGDGNVLLVDMTAEQGSAQHYIKGKAVSSLEETLQTKDRALVQENLYVVTEGSNSDRLSRNLPQRFTKLVPKLKASDFDYIIFDMPPVSQISVTPRLAGFMDMMLLVVESEKTTPEAVEKGSALLSQSGVHVGVVLNKAQAYVPKFLQTDSMDEA